MFTGIFPAVFGLPNLILYIMEIILNENCSSFTGSLNGSYGYAVRKHKGGFYLFRYSRGKVPYDGHLSAIAALAKMAVAGLCIAEVKCSAGELKQAFQEAGYVFGSALGILPNKLILGAEQVLFYLDCWCPWVVK